MEYRDELDRSATPKGGVISLAHEASIGLGQLTIEPALRLVRHDKGAEEVLQPRIMQVLVALIRANAARSADLRTPSTSQLLGWRGRRRRGLDQSRHRPVAAVERGHRPRLFPGRNHHQGWLSADSGVADDGGSDRRSAIRHAAGGCPNALHLRPAVRQHERRSGAGVLQRRHQRGHYHRPFQGLGSGCGVAQQRFPLQGPATWTCRKSRAKARRQPCVWKAAKSARRGGRVRITAQLIDGATNDPVWAERYDRDLIDIFAVQDEISQRHRRGAGNSKLPTGREEGDRAARNSITPRPTTSI